MRIAISKKEYLILAEIYDFDKNPNEIEVDNSGSFMYLVISEEFADELRDAVSETLVENGFDRDYEVTERGRLLEGLIDKLYID